MSPGLCLHAFLNEEQSREVSSCRVLQFMKGFRMFPLICCNIFKSVMCTSILQMMKLNVHLSGKPRYSESSILLLYTVSALSIDSEELSIRACSVYVKDY